MRRRIKAFIPVIFIFISTVTYTAFAGNLHNNYDPETNNVARTALGPGRTDVGRIHALNRLFHPTHSQSMGECRHCVPFPRTEGSPGYTRSAMNLYDTNDSDDENTTKEHLFHITLRTTQGGFTDDRSPIGQLGGGQMALVIQPRFLPFAVSWFTEYYTNSPEPTHNYEISDLIAWNLLYVTHPFSWERVTVFGGGGCGIVWVPKSEENFEEYETAFMANLEAGVSYRVVWKVGLCAMGKYLYAQKDVNGERFIDFSEFVFMVGLQVDFGLF